MIGDIIAAIDWNLVWIVVLAFVKAFVIVNLLMAVFGFMTYVERRVLGRMQARYGPNRVGPFGLLQFLADGLKLATKEDIVPSQGNFWVHTLAPVLALAPALIIFAVVPIGPSIPLGEVAAGARIEDGASWTWYIANVNVGYLYAAAIASLGVYGIVLAGWSSNNKYSLLGGLRASAQMISYEIPQGLAALTAVIMAGTINLYEIVEQQQRSGLPFGFLPIFGWIAFAIYLVSAVAETNRTPFDLPEAEGELGAGFHTEYSSMKWSAFFAAEYINMVNVSALASVLFLGGWWPMIGAWTGLPWLDGIIGPIIFILKIAFFMFCFIWLRATFPRLRYDRLMNLGWKFLFPLALANLTLTAIWVALWPRGWWPLI